MLKKIIYAVLMGAGLGMIYTFSAIDSEYQLMGLYAGVIIYTIGILNLYRLSKLK